MPLFAKAGYASVVSPLIGNLLDFALEVGLVEVQGSVPYTDEGEALAVLVPYESLDVAVELLSHIVLLASGEVIDAEAVAVTVFAIGRELRIGVVTRIVLQVLWVVDCLVAHALGSVNLWLHIASLLTEVLGLARTYII